MNGAAVRRGAALVVLSVCASRAAAAGPGAPFRTGNLSPPVSIFGLPAWESAEHGTRVAFTSELANHYQLARRGGEALILDGETWRTTVSLRRGIAERWTLGIEIPYYRQSGGVLDDVIDTWHSLLALPDGGRNRREEGRLEFVLADERGPFYVLERSASGLGDLQLSAGRTVGPEGGMFLSAALKLPTGDEALLAGSGAFDFAVTLLRGSALSVRGRSAAFFWGVGAAVLGEPETIAFDASSTALFGMLGASVKPGQRLGVKAQIDMHSPLYDSPLEELGEPGVQATIGGWWEINERAVVEAAVNEDLAVSTSPDVVLHVNVRWAF